MMSTALGELDVAPERYDQKTLTRLAAIPEAAQLAKCQTRSI
jgi:hypothetical protein